MMTDDGEKKPEKKGGKARTKTDRVLRRPNMNPKFEDESIKKELNDVCQGNGKFELDNQIEAFSDPFRCCVLSNFLQDDHFLEGLRSELLDQIFIMKNNDLYKFQQTDDLKKFTAPHSKALRKLFRTEVRDWLQDVTGIELSDKVDLTCSRYDYTDNLLCHDDELEGRRIAFILYLTPPWKESDGGALQLFDVDEHGQPREVVKSLVPKWNNFAFFLVDPVSFHQVSEVITEDKTRLSINGWFHGPPVLRPPVYEEPARQLQPHTHIEHEVVFRWINPIYLQPEPQTQIRMKFQQDSEIELQGFLREDKYHQMSKALASDVIQWEFVGPPNKRHFYRAKEEHLPDVVKECLNLFQSEAMFLTLSNLTGLSLHRLAISHSDSESESDSDSDENGPPRQPKRVRLDRENEPRPRPRNPKCHRELRRWTQGCYTLLHDTDPSNTEYALDLRVTFNTHGWFQAMGGYVSYITKGEDEELLTVNPAENSLALVYRDRETLRAVKHVNSTIKHLLSGRPEFTDISFVYYE